MVLRGFVAESLLLVSNGRFCCLEAFDGEGRIPYTYGSFSNCKSLSPRKVVKTGVGDPTGPQPATIGQSLLGILALIGNCPFGTIYSNSFGVAEHKALRDDALCKV